MRKGNVFIENKKVGLIEETDQGYRFTYDEEYLMEEDAKSISLTMPLQKEAYESKVLFPFFDGLIPEGWLYDITIQNWKLSQKDRFGVLLVACKDAIGNVSVREKDEK